MSKAKSTLTVFFIFAAVAACSQSADARDAVTLQDEMNTLTAAERAEGWQLLFDGQSTAGWRRFREDRISDGWQVSDGALTRVARGGDIITTREFENFELKLEWMVGEGGNSGIMYRVSEDVRRTFESGPEMQVLDDERHPDGQSPLTSAGSNYGIQAPTPGVVNPAGEWNAVRLILNGAHVEHWLNGTKVVEYELGSPEWEELVRNSKFVEWPRYGRATRGHIALQDHGDWVAYRNIKIRELP